jgi:hypothetical protein
MATLIGDNTTLVAAVSRSTDKLDIFTSDTLGRIWTAAWRPGFTQWDGPWLINTNNSRSVGRVLSPTPVYTVSRSTDKLDIFATDENGVIQTAAWEPSFSEWSEWRQVAGGVAAFGSHVTAVSRSTDKLDIFVVGLDRRVYTAAWEPGFGADWHGWRVIGDAHFDQGAPVHAVSRSSDKLDIFATDVTGAILTSAWEPGLREWRPWRQVAGGVANPGAHVTAVSRSTDKLDIFVSSHEFAREEPGGSVYTASWEPGGGDWRGWVQLGYVAGGSLGYIFAANGAPVGAVSRSTDKLDIFVSRVVFVLDGNNYVTTAGGVVTSAWEPGFADWRPWRLVADGGDANWASPVAAVSRNTDKLDIFATAANGVVQTAAWEPDFGADWHGWWPA